MRNNGIPLYRKIYNDILSKIQQGIFEKNNLLPSEKEFQEFYNVSRITVRRAVDELQNEGYVVKQPGIGTIVINDKALMNLKGINSFSSENPNESSVLISFKETTPPLNVRMALKLREEEKVYQIERVRKSNKKIIGFHRAFIPVNLISLSQHDFKHEHASLYRILEVNGVGITHGYETIESIGSNEVLSNLLEIDINTPILYKERISLNNQTYVEFVEIYYIGKAYKYQVELKNL